MGSDDRHRIQYKSPLRPCKEIRDTETQVPAAIEGLYSLAALRYAKVLTPGDAHKGAQGTTFDRAVLEQQAVCCVWNLPQFGGIGDTCGESEASNVHPLMTNVTLDQEGSHLNRCFHSAYYEQDALFQSLDEG